MSDITLNRPKALWESKNPVLRNGQYGFEEETGKLKQGDGVKKWKDLPYLNVSPYTLPAKPVSLGVTPTEVTATATATADAAIAASHDTDPERETFVPTRLSAAALKAMFSPPVGPWKDLVRAAQFGLSHTAAVFGDSTSDNLSNTFEWPLLVLKQLGTKFPSVRMEHYQFDDVAQAYGTANVVNAGAAATGGVIVSDTFSVDGTTTTGAAADTKGTWAANNGTNPKSGGKATLAASGAISATTPLQDSTVTAKVLINTAGLSGFNSFRFGNAFSNSQLSGFGIYALFSLNGPWVTYLQLYKRVASGLVPLTELETLPDLGLWNVSNKAVTIETKLEGNAFTFTLAVAGGQTIVRSGTITNQEKSEIGFFAGMGGNPGNATAGLAVDELTVSTPVIPTPTIKIYNGSVAGKNPDYLTGRLPKLLPVAMDSIFLSYGHNAHLRPGGPDAFVADYKAAIDGLRAVQSTPKLYVGSQNPEFAPRDASMVALHAARQMRIIDVARDNGCTYVPVYEAFTNYAVDNGKSLVQADGVHPTNPTTLAVTDGFGSTLWAKTVTGLN